MNAEPLLLGVDIGGTKVEAALVDAQGKVRDEHSPKIMEEVS